MKINIEFSKNIPKALLLLADPSENMIEEYIQTGQCYLATNNDEIIGVIVLLKTRPKTMEIMNIAEKEEYQKQGIGKQLIEFAICKAKKDNFNTLEIGTGNPAVHQLLLYQKCGFRIVGIDADYFRRNYEERIYENGIECRDMIRLKMDLTK